MHIPGHYNQRVVLSTCSHTHMHTIPSGGLGTPQCEAAAPLSPGSRSNMHPVRAPPVSLCTKVLYSHIYPHRPPPAHAQTTPVSQGSEGEKRRAAALVDAGDAGEDHLGPTVGARHTRLDRLAPAHEAAAALVLRHGGRGRGLGPVALHTDTKRHEGVAGVAYTCQGGGVVGLFSVLGIQWGTGS